MKLFGAWWGREVRVSSSPLSCWHGILPLHGAISNHLQGLQANAGELLVFSPGQEVDVTWHEGTKAIVIALMRPCCSTTERHHQVHHAQSPTQALLFQGNNPAMRSLGNLLRMVDSESGNTAGLLATPFGQSHVQHLFCENLLHLLPSLYSEPPRRLLPGTVKRVVDFIHANLEQPLCITQLVTVSGTSRRSLEQAFRNGLGTSPQRYIQHCRLLAMRKVLLSTNRVKYSCRRWPSSGGLRNPATLPPPTSKRLASCPRKRWPGQIDGKPLQAQRPARPRPTRISRCRS